MLLPGFLRNLRRKKYPNQFQPFPFKGSFQKKKILDNGERGPLTTKREEELHKMIHDAIELFDDSDINWAVDGGLSISILRNKFIGEHRDIDIAVEESQIKALQSLIESKGYGLFITLNAEKGRDQMIMKRVDWKEYSTAPTFLFWVIAIDKDGLIQKGKPLSFINTHIVKRSSEGIPLSETGRMLFTEWFKPIVANWYRGEKAIPVSHPAKTAYYKLFSMRSYDETDLYYLAGSRALTIKDMKNIKLMLIGEAPSEVYRKRKIVMKRMEEIINT